MEKDLDLKIENLVFCESGNTNSRIRNALIAQGVRTLGDLVRRSEKEVLLFPGMGRTALNKIWEYLERRNLSFSDKPCASKPVDWEHRRYEIAKDILASYTTNSKRDLAEWSAKARAIEAVKQADALIEVLKDGIPLS